MRNLLIMAVIAAAALAIVYNNRPGLEATMPDVDEVRAHADTSAPGNRQETAERIVLDIMVHTLDELRVVLDRAEEVATRPHDREQDAGVVLVLHGPEVEFFSTRNYEQYKDIVDQAARLDAFDIVDVKICQAMMAIKGIARDDIPAFIEQVPDGAAEVNRLVSEGYVYF